MSAPNGNDKPIHILFVGAGAVGCFYASRLHHPSQNIHVSLVCRSNYSVVAASGVHLKTHTFGTYHFVPHAVFSSIASARPQTSSSSSAPASGWDYVIVTTKALPDIVDDSRTIAPVVTPAKTTIVLIQNGYGVELPHRRMFPTNPIVSAVTIISAALVAPNVVVQNRWTRISFGAYSDGGASSASSISSDSISSDSISSDSISSTKEKEMRELQKTGGERVDWLVETMKELGGIKDAEAYDEVGLQTVRWHKLAINAAFNPSSILSGGLGNSEMVRDPELRAHLKGCMDEIFHAAEKVLGRELPGKLARPEAILRSTERNVGGKPSMLLDWEAGRPLELEVILGNPVRMARERGVEMKKLSSLYALLRSMQEVRNGRKEEEKNSGGAKL